MLWMVAVWSFLLLSRFFVEAVDLSLAKNLDQIEAINDGDRANNVFALMFGWVPGIVLALLSWLLDRVLAFIKAAINKHRAKIT